MKKIILLPVEESILFQEDDGKLTLCKKPVQSDGIGQPMGLFIVDTKEKINRGDWCAEATRIFKCNSIYRHPSMKKVTMAGDDDESINIENAYKIIAAIDKTLGVPLINAAFVRLFIERDGDIPAIDVTISRDNKYALVKGRADDRPEFEEWLKDKGWRPTHTYVRCIGTDGDGCPEMKYNGKEELRNEYDSERRIVKKYGRNLQNEIRLTKSTHP